MFQYENLSVTRKLFVDKTLETFPDISNQISRDQIEQVMSTHNLKFPQWLTISDNKLDRNLFGFPNKTEKEVVIETEEEILDKIKERFAAIDLCVKSAAENKMRSVIISGPPGVGKSFGVTRVLENFSGCNYVFASGKSAATGLYKLLYENRFPNCVIVLDDIDSVFESIDSLNILKKCCDRSKARKISWLTETKFVSDEDGEEIPKSFEFEGNIIFITNIDFDEQISKGSKLSPHFDALMSRSFYISLGIKSKREMVLRIKQVVKEEKMLKQEGLSEQEENKILDFIHKNANRLRDLSLRMCANLSDLYKIDPDNFEHLARVTCFRA